MPWLNGRDSFKRKGFCPRPLLRRCSPRKQQMERIHLSILSVLFVNRSTSMRWSFRVVTRVSAMNVKKERRRRRRSHFWSLSLSLSSHRYSNGSGGKWRTRMSTVPSSTSAHRSDQSQSLPSQMRHRLARNPTAEILPSLRLSFGLTDIRCRSSGFVHASHGRAPSPTAVRRKWRGSDAFHRRPAPVGANRTDRD